jgi:4-alpha-glucanotransferase
LSDEIDFEDFQRENSYWLGDFALFKVLKEFHHGAAWYEWEEKFRDRDRQALEAFWRENVEKVTFHMWLQWIIRGQFKSCRQYASANGGF